MLGAIIGDIVGSRFEWDNYKAKDFQFFTDNCHPTDDTSMSLAVCAAILTSAPDYEDLSENAVKWMRKLGAEYPHGFGSRFKAWLLSQEPHPYNSYGNGSAMRVSGAGFAANSLEEAKLIAAKVTEVTHNHPEGMKGAEATAVAVYLAKTGTSKEKIKEIINQDYYQMNFTLGEIRDDYHFDVSCQGSVPQALEAFFESSDFCDAIRNAISIGGDSDTIGAITGGIAEAYYGIPTDIRNMALCYLDKRMKTILEIFEEKYQK